MPEVRRNVTFLRNRGTLFVEIWDVSWDFMGFNVIIVGFQYECVNWDDEIPNIWENAKNLPNHQRASDMNPQISNQVSASSEWKDHLKHLKIPKTASV